jgi:hypothetical protein
VTIIDEALAFLEQRKKSMRCSDLEQVLKSLGFEVGDCRRAGHKKIKHSGIAGFFGSSFDGGHKADSEIKFCYVAGVIRLIKQYRVELEKLMEQRQ